MNDYRHVIAEKIAVFDQLLRQMVIRRGPLGSSDCAIIFHENPSDLRDNPTSEDSTRLSLIPYNGVRGNDLDSEEFDDAGQFTYNRTDRFVQFAFKRRTFYIDLPNTTLWPDEARQLMSRRSGFFYLSQRRFPGMSF